jgi:hypothetical protein
MQSNSIHPQRRWPQKSIAIRFGAARWIFAATALVLLPAGCSKTSPDRAAVVPVEGAITFEGKPLPGALIVLHPKGQAQTSIPTPRAQVEKDGSFRFSTYEAGDGAPPGDYVATISWYKLVGQAGDVKAGPNVLPAKYSNPKTSKWEIRVADAATRLPPVQLRR